MKALHFQYSHPHLTALFWILFILNMHPSYSMMVFLRFPIIFCISGISKGKKNPKTCRQALWLTVLYLNPKESTSL